MYVIFSGEHKSKPEQLYLSKEFFGGEECAIEVKVKMIYDGKEGDIINQYVTFTKIYNEQVKLHGRTREAILETIRICKDKNVLKEYLENREQEVVNIMMTLFDDEYILKTYVKSKEREAAEKATRRANEKAKEKAKAATQKLYRKGTSIEDIAEILDVTIEFDGKPVQFQHKKDGKGNPYADVISAHMPLRKAMQTASRKAFLSMLA